MKLNQWMAMPALLAGVAAAGAAEVYVCRGDGGIEYRQDPGGRDCRRARLATIGSVGAQPAPPARQQAIVPAAPPDTPRARLADERARLEALRREYNGGEPERRGDERNYAKYLQRAAALKAAIDAAEARIVGLEQDARR